MRSRPRVYTHDDGLEVELGGVPKNVIAIGVSISDGVGGCPGGEPDYLRRSPGPTVLVLACRLSNLPEST